MLPLNEDALRSRFWNLRKERDLIYAKSAPSRAEYEALNVQIDALLQQQKKFSSVFKEIEAPLVSIDKELSMIAGALKGKTGQPPEED